MEKRKACSSKWRRCSSLEIWIDRTYIITDCKNLDEEDKMMSSFGLKYHERSMNASGLEARERLDAEEAKRALRRNPEGIALAPAIDIH